MLCIGYTLHAVYSINKFTSHHLYTIFLSKVSNKAGSAECSAQLRVEPTGEPKEAVEEVIAEEEQPVAESAPAATDDTNGKKKKKKEKRKESVVDEPVTEEKVETVETAPAEAAPKEEKREKKEKAPKFSSELKDQTVTEGSEVKLSCKVKGQPTPEVTWQLNGSDIKDNSVYNISFDGEKCVLKIKDAKAEYSGTYTVQV